MNHKLTTGLFITRGNYIHNFKYNYSKSNYTGCSNKVIIICPIHGEFLQQPQVHIRRQGCPKCGKIKAAKNKISCYKKSDWVKIATKNNNSFVYIIKCYNKSESFIKIGITSKSVKERFKYNFPYNYDILFEFSRSPEQTWELEKTFHKEAKNHKYTPKKSFNGNNECFDLNIFESIAWLLPEI